VVAMLSRQKTFDGKHTKRMNITNATRWFIDTSCIFLFKLTCSPVKGPPFVSEPEFSELFQVYSKISSDVEKGELWWGQFSFFILLIIAV
jgi:hypothetical protein